jgi:hypothetical protein
MHINWVKYHPKEQRGHHMARRALAVAARVDANQNDGRAYRDEPEQRPNVGEQHANDAAHRRDADERPSEGVLLTRRKRRLRWGWSPESSGRLRRRQWSFVHQWTISLGGPNAPVLANERRD